MSRKAFHNINKGGKDQSLIRQGHTSPLRILIILAVSIFISEACVMAFLSYFSISSIYIRAIIDPLFFMLIISPFYYVFLFRPMSAQVKKHQQAESQLKETQEKLKGSPEPSYHGTSEASARDDDSQSKIFTGIIQSYPSPRRVLIILAASAFFAETNIMIILPFVPSLSPFLEAMFDSFLLILFLLPVLYLFAYRPMIMHLKRRKKAENDLENANKLLEIRVRERTAELQHSNIQLEREIAQRLQYEEQLSLSASVFENTIEGILLTGIDGSIEKVNPSFSLITGYSEGEVIGQNPRILKSDHHTKEFYKNIWNSLLQKGEWKGEIWNRRKSGEVYAEWLSINSIRDSHGETTHYVGLFHDITELKQSQDKLSFQAYHDALTGLPNRTMVSDRLEMSLANAHRHNNKVAVIFLDLDNFKNINDTLGHNVGDQYLQEAAKRLKDVCRIEDTVARLGGDEFLIILPVINNEDDPVQLARRIVTSFSMPFILEGHELTISASLGITIYPIDGEDVDSLLKNADMAMYRAKETGKNNYQLFTPELNTKVKGKVDLENGIRHALKNNEFRVYYQPKVDIASGSFYGVEALIRWTRPDGKSISPAEFIPVAESSGLIIPIGMWVLETACKECKMWLEAGYAVELSVNLSLRQFSQGNLVQIVKDILRETGLPPDLLELEITESSVMENEEEAIEILRQLKAVGIKLCIDDFGTGYSSLAYLKKMPIDTLKIDQSFIMNLPGSREDAAITSAIVSLAKKLSLATIAEGVEKPDQFKFLRDIECDKIQGFLFSPAVPANTLFSYLKEGKKLDYAGTVQPTAQA